MECAKCKAIMKMSDNKKFWFCHTCGYSDIVKDQDCREIINKYDWTMRGDGTRIEWVSREELRKFPYIIAHEYDRVRNLLESNQPYGAIMQLKDAYETIVKYIVLLESVRICNKKVKNDNEIIIIKELTEKLLLLSNWQKLIDKISVLNDVDNDLREVMKDLSRILKNDGPIKFIEWRNRILGHGALGHIESEKYKNEFVKMLEQLTNHLKQYAGQYKQMYIFIGDCKLVGIKLDDNLRESSFDCLTIKDYRKNINIKLFPFLVFKNGDIYFFDSFDNSKKCTDILSYPIGDKLQIKKKDDEHSICSKIAEIHSAYQKEYKKRKLNEMLVNQAGSFEYDVFLAESEKLLLENCSINDSVKVKYMEKWIQNSIKNNRKGVFLFQANAEMGKTVSVMQLEGRINNRIGIHATTVKAVYLNDSTNSRIGFIFDAIEHSLFEDIDGKNLIRRENKVVLHQGLGKDESKKNMADFLNSTKLSLYSAGICSENLLLILDGIDELRENELDILDYIPRVSQLNDGVYILLTSRTNGELSETKKSKLNGLDYTEKLIKVKSDEDLDIDNLQKEYVLTQLPEVTPNIIDVITNQGKSSFLVTHLIVFLIKNKVIEFDKINELKSVEKILIKYFQYLSSIYCEKNNHSLYKIVYLLASDNKSRELKDISYQIGESETSFMMVGILHDLKAILFAEHRISNQYRISHRDLGEMLLNTLKFMGKYDEVEKEIILGWKNNIENICYWDSEELQATQSPDDYSQLLNDMTNINNIELTFLLEFFEHTLIERIDEWKKLLNHANCIMLLIKLFTGTNNNINTSLVAFCKSILAEKIGDFIFEQSKCCTDEKKRAEWGLILIICSAFTDWRECFLEIYKNDEIESFCEGKSYMHDNYSVIKEKYNEALEYINEVGSNNISQELYIFVILIEEALVSMSKMFIDLYCELDKNLVSLWQKKLANINEKSVKRYDEKMLVHMDMKLFCEEHALIRAYYSENKDDEIKDVREKIGDIKRRLIKYELNEHEKFNIEKEELFTKLGLYSPRGFELIKEIPNNVILIANKLTELVEKQITLVRKNGEESIIEGELSEDIRCISQLMNRYVNYNMVSKTVSKASNVRNALKLSALANRLFESLSDSKKDYYILQRVVVITNYIMLLNNYNMIEERNKYIKWYLKNKEVLQSLINMRRGQACESAEHSVWMLEAVVSNFQDKDVIGTIRGVTKPYFELHINKNGQYQARCSENHYSKPVSIGEDKTSILVEFNRKYCNVCYEGECPAYEGVHKVLLNNENCKFIYEGTK